MKCLCFKFKKSHEDGLPKENFMHEVFMFQEKNTKSDYQRETSCMKCLCLKFKKSIKAGLPKENFMHEVLIKNAHEEGLPKANFMHEVSS